MKTYAVVMMLAAFALSGGADAADTLCSVAPSIYSDAKDAYPDSASALEELESHGIATWYSDRNMDGIETDTITQLVAECPKSSRLNLVIYGLPNKDCDAGYSNGNGVVKNADDYENFLQQLMYIIEDRKVLYILEPDAVGLLADGGCAVESDYESNLATAIKMLSKNDNAEIYLDVGFWTLEKSNTTSAVAKIVKKLAKSGRIKGIALNTSNYRSTSKMEELCSTFQEAVDSTDMHCIIDTSRNYQKFADPKSSEWCNVRDAGIGAPPTNVTELDIIDYFVYVKPPGASDGTCDDESSAAMAGPEAGEFFNAHFVKLWNQGYFVSEKGMNTIADTSEDSSAVRWSSSLGAWSSMAVAAVLTLGLGW